MEKIEKKSKFNKEVALASKQQVSWIFLSKFNKRIDFNDSG